jgi:hypothetical protein
MADLFQKITDSRNLIEKIGAMIPGFKGYVDRNARRDADKMLRESVAVRLEQQWSRVSDLQRQLIGQGSIELVDDLEASAIKLRMLIDRIRTASYGYAGFFDAVKIQEADLVKLYQRGHARAGLSGCLERTQRSDPGRGARESVTFIRPIRSEDREFRTGKTPRRERNPWQEYSMLWNIRTRCAMRSSIGSPKADSAISASVRR